MAGHGLQVNQYASQLACSSAVLLLHQRCLPGKMAEMGWEMESKNSENTVCVCEDGFVIILVNIVWVLDYDCSLWRWCIIQHCINPCCCRCDIVLITHTHSTAHDQTCTHESWLVQQKWEKNSVHFTKTSRRKKNIHIHCKAKPLWRQFLWLLEDSFTKTFWWQLFWGSCQHSCTEYTQLHHHHRYSSCDTSDNLIPVQNCFFIIIIFFCV